MKDKIFNSIIIIISLFVLLELFIKKKVIYSAILYALNIWAKVLIPSLFPFFIISDILINYNITSYIPRYIKSFLKKLFNISENQITILLLSMISGFPSNARNTRTLYDNNLITLEEANHILMFSHFANPMFILTTIALFFFKNKEIGIILFISHYLSNMILGFLVRNIGKYNDNIYDNNSTFDSFGNIFVKSIKKSIDTILMICGILVVFMMLSNIIITTFNFNVYNAAIIKGIFEITIGIEAICKLNISNIYKCVISSCFLAFGGVSVHVQVLSQITNTKIKYSYFLLGRLYQLIISGIITFIICYFLKI